MKQLHTSAPFPALVSEPIVAQVPKKFAPPAHTSTYEALDESPLPVCEAD